VWVRLLAQEFPHAMGAAKRKRPKKKKKRKKEKGNANLGIPLYLI